MLTLRNTSDTSSALSKTQRSFDASNDNFGVKSFDNILFNNALKKVDAITFVETMIADAQIKKQSEQIAYKLSVLGHNPFLDNGISMIGLISGAIISLSSYRNINIIPEVSRRNRQPLLHEFDLFLKENPSVRKYARVAVVTSGKRFPISDFQERLDIFNKQLGRYIELSKKNDIDIILCAIEFTVDEDRTINLHANLVSSPKKSFGSKGWSEWLATSRKHFNNQMLHDAGKVRDTKEIIKYVCKYSEIANLDGESLVVIAKALHKKQLIRPLGIFSTWRKDVKDSGQKVQFDQTSKRLVRTQVKKRKPEAGSNEAIEDDIYASHKAEERKRFNAALARTSAHTREKEPIENQILTKTLPQNQATLLAEPFVVVMNFNGSPRTENGRKGLEAIETQREFHFKMLAEKGVHADDLACGSSKLDTPTIIPAQLLSSLPLISYKRRAKLFKLLNLSKNASDDDVRSAVEQALQLYYPKNFHEWSANYADNIELLERGRQKQDDYLENREQSLKFEEYMSSYEDVENSISYSEYSIYDYDELDDLIPF